MRACLSSFTSRVRTRLTRFKLRLRRNSRGNVIISLRPSRRGSLPSLTLVLHRIKSSSRFRKVLTRTLLESRR